MVAADLKCWQKWNFWDSYTGRPMTNVEVHTRFGGNRSRNGWRHFFIYLHYGSRRPSWIYLLLILDHPRRPAWWLHFPCQWRNDPVWSDWDVAILRICWVGWKCPFAPPIGQFLQILTPKSDQISQRRPKGTNGCKNTLFKLLSIIIASSIWPVALVKKGIR